MELCGDCRLNKPQRDLFSRHYHKSSFALFQIQSLCRRQKSAIVIIIFPKAGEIMQEEPVLEAVTPISAPEKLAWTRLGTVRLEKKEYDRYIALMDTPFTPDQLGRLTCLAEAHGYGVLVLEPGQMDLEKVLEDCEVLCGYFPKALLQRAAQLRWLHLPSAGADKYVDESIYPNPDVTLTNSSGAFGAAIAEQLVMGSLMLLRRMPEYQRQQREKIWRRAGPLRFLRGSLVTVLGTGNLGGTFAGYCKAMGASVQGVNTSGKTGLEHFSAVYPVEKLPEAVQGADIVAACLPLTRETKGLIDRRVFAAMRPGAIFLNVGRGKTVNQQDLIHALQGGGLGGAMLDVAEEEPMPPECPLWDMEHVILTPHVSGSDQDEANAAEIFSIFMDNLSRYFAGQPLRNVVDRKKGY